MYQLNVIPLEDDYELHTMDVPYENMKSVVKNHDLFFTARKNKLNPQNSLQALGHCMDHPKANASQQFKSRAEAEEASREMEPGIITYFIIKPEASRAMVLYAAKVKNPLRKSEIKAPVVAQLAFYHSNANLRVLFKKPD